jgi:hypothetical protein
MPSTLPRQIGAASFPATPPTGGHDLARKKRPPSEAASISSALLHSVLFVPPKPLGMRSAPVRVTLFVAAEQDAKTHASPAVAFIA